MGLTTAGLTRSIIVHYHASKQSWRQPLPYVALPPSKWLNAPSQSREPTTLQYMLPNPMRN
jgi:hypothetical protein